MMRSPIFVIVATTLLMLQITPGHCLEGSASNTESAANKERDSRAGQMQSLRHQLKSADKDHRRSQNTNEEERRLGGSVRYWRRQSEIRDQLYFIKFHRAKKHHPAAAVVDSGRWKTVFSSWWNEISSKDLLPGMKKREEVWRFFGVDTEEFNQRYATHRTPRCLSRSWCTFVYNRFL